MLVLVGFVIVTASVIIGYTMHGGQMGVLIQVNEIVILCGAGLGTLIVASPMSQIKNIIHQILSTIKTAGPTQKDYMDLLGLLYELCKTIKANPLGIEAHIEKPENSEIFKKFPSVLKNHHAMHFLCDTLKVQVSSQMSPYDLEELMDADIQSAHAEEAQAPAAVNKVSDAMPGLGIVAAVLGVVITMGKLTEGKEVIGHSVAAALVGTFMGILISYGFMGPLAAKMDSLNGENGKYLDVIKVALLALAKNASPKVCVEFARRAIPPAVRPSFEDVDKATSAGGGKAAA